MLIQKRNSEFTIKGRVLLLLCSYRGGIGNRGPFSVAERAPALGRLGYAADWLMCLSLRRFIAQYRDFAANPRTLTYQAGLVRELDLGSASEVTCVIDDAYADYAALDDLGYTGRCEVQPPRRFAALAADFDTVVLVYPDALGLGWTNLERDLRRTCNAKLMFVNGRRRILQFADEDFSALRWRRLLANTRLAELAMAAAIVPVGMILATVDALRGKS